MSEPSKLLILIGSPRKSGNCAFLTTRAGAAAQEAGASVETIFLHDLDAVSYTHLRAHET